MREPDSGNDSVDRDQVAHALELYGLIEYVFSRYQINSRKSLSFL